MAKTSCVIQGPRSIVALYNQDCIAGMPHRLEPESVDVVVTSPPYNLGIDYGRYDDTISRSDYLAWIDNWADVVESILSRQGSLFLNIGSKPTDPTVPFQVLERMQKHFALQNVIHWIKSIAIEKEDVGAYPIITGDISVGHYKPINSPRFVNDCHEYIFHLTKQGNVLLDRLAIGVPYQDKSNVGRWNAAQRDLRCRGNTWFIPYETIRSRRDQRPHPATFPVKLAEMCIQLHGVNHTRQVLDPFMGLGPVAVAALHLQVDFAGFEIDPTYFGEARKRVRAEAARVQL